MNANELYIYILNSNLINFLIMLSLLVLIFKKAKLGRVIDSLADEIKTNVTSSAEAVQKVLKDYKEAKRKSKTLDVKKGEIIDSAREIIRKLDEENKKSISKKEAELNLNLEKTADSSFKRKFQNTTLEIQEAVYKLSLDTVKNLMTEELQKKLIVNSLDEFDKIEGGLK